MTNAAKFKNYNLWVRSLYIPSSHLRFLTYTANTIFLNNPRCKILYHSMPSRIWYFIFDLQIFRILIFMLPSTMNYSGICVFHMQHLYQQQCLLAWTFTLWSFLHVEDSTHPHYCRNSTNTDWQTVLGSNCLRPTSTWISHSSLHPHTSENS